MPDEILITTSTPSGTVQTIQLATTSPVYQFYYDGATFIWLSTLILGIAFFFTIAGFFYKRMKK